MTIPRIFHRHRAVHEFHAWSMHPALSSVLVHECWCRAVRFPDAPFRRLRRWSRRNR
jgi:hypothetical protein